MSSSPTNPPPAPAKHKDRTGSRGSHGHGSDMSHTAVYHCALRVMLSQLTQRRVGGTADGRPFSISNSSAQRARSDQPQTGAPSSASHQEGVIANGRPHERGGHLGDSRTN